MATHDLRKRGPIVERTKRASNSASVIVGPLPVPCPPRARGVTQIYGATRSSGSPSIGNSTTERIVSRPARLGR